MQLDDIPKKLRFEYTKVCTCCLKENTLLSQNDDLPEYYAEVFLKCVCGEYIEFDLPVN